MRQFILLGLVFVCCDDTVQKLLSVLGNIAANEVYWTCTVFAFRWRRCTSPPLSCRQFVVLEGIWGFGTRGSNLILVFLSGVFWARVSTFRYMFDAPSLRYTVDAEFACPCSSGDCG